MRTFALMLAAALTTVLIGCSSAKLVPLDTGGQHLPVHLTVLQSCHKLRADMLANGGPPDEPTLRYIARHAASTKVATLAKVAAKDVGYTSLSFTIAMDVLHHVCAAHGVQFPGWRRQTAAPMAARSGSQPQHGFGRLAEHDARRGPGPPADRDTGTMPAAA